MTDPKLTVILPVYNAEPYLAPAMDSILTQSFTDFELIAVDDGSTDTSADTLGKYAQADARVKVIRQENGGVSRSCNTAIQAGKGVYVARMDADDIAWPGRFEKQIVYLDAHPETVALGTRARLIDPEGRPLKTYDMPLTHEEIDARHASGRGLASICGSALIMRMEAVRQVGYYDETFTSAHDVEFYLRLAEIGKLENLPDILQDYRMHMSSIGHSGRSKQRHFAWEAARMAAERRGTPFTEPEPDATQPNASRADLFRKWGWWAMSGKNIASARYYARKAVLSNPANVENWRLAAVALRGH